MPKTTTVLLAIVAAGVLLIAGFMAKDRWDRYQLGKALERQRTMESFRETCLDRSPAGPATLEFRQTSCRWYGAMLMGDQAVEKLEQELAAEHRAKYPEQYDLRPKTPAAGEPAR
jgi:hypothetical protein